MSTDGLTPDTIKKQHGIEIAKGLTFETHGVTEQAAREFLNTDAGTLYWWRVAESAAPGTLSSAIDDRAVEQLMSGRELPRTETIQPGEALVKFVAEGQSLSAHSPYWARESEANAAIAAGRNISDYYGLPIGSEAPRYDMYRMTPKVPTEIFISTVAATSELDGVVTKHGGAEQALVPNRKLFHEPVRFNSIGNIPTLATEIERGGLASGVARGAGVLGAAAVVYDATTSIARTSDLLHEGNTVGAASEIEHFGSRNLGMLGGAVLGAELAGAAGIESGPFDLVLAGAGGVVGAVGGNKLAAAYDRHKIYNQTDAQGVTWHYHPDQPQNGWTRTVTDGFAERGLSHVHAEAASPALAERLTFQANNTAVELALAHPVTPRDPWTQPAIAQDTASFGDPPWQRDPQTGAWQREIRAPFVEHGMTPASRMETANPQRAAQLDAAAKQVIAANLASSKRGIAHHYAEVYQQRGWERYGPMPADVTHTLMTPIDTLQASNGNTYTRGADGQWTTPGHLWGTNIAPDAVGAELDATEAMLTHAASRSTPSSVHAPNPNAPAHHREESAATRGDTAILPPFSDPGHPQHALHTTLRGLLPATTTGARLAQATAACRLAGINKSEDLSGIYSGGNGKIVFTTHSLFANIAEMDVSKPAPTVQQSLQAVKAFDQQQAQQQERFRQIDMPDQAQRGPSL